MDTLAGPVASIFQRTILNILCRLNSTRPQTKSINGGTNVLPQKATADGELRRKKENIK